MLSKYTAIPLDDETLIKECENDFEKFYFVSMVSVIDEIKCTRFLLHLAIFSVLRSFSSKIAFFSRNIWQRVVIWKKLPLVLSQSKSYMPN